MSRRRKPDARTPGARTGARFCAVQALFQMEAAGHDAERVVAEFLAHRIGATGEDAGPSEVDAPFFAQLVDAAVTWQARIDQATDRALVARWPLGRIDPVLRAIFRAAGAEIVLRAAPLEVTLAEFVMLARSFCGDRPETGLVNAVLEHMAPELRADTAPDTPPPAEG